MITGRSGDTGSTELCSGSEDRAAAAGDHNEGADGAGGAGGVGGAAPTGSGGMAVETGDWLRVGPGGAWLPPGVGVACPYSCVLELPDGVRVCAVCSGEGPCMRTLRAGACAAGVVSGVVVGVGT